MIRWIFGKLWINVYERQTCSGERQNLLIFNTIQTKQSIHFIQTKHNWRAILHYALPRFFHPKDLHVISLFGILSQIWYNFTWKCLFEFTIHIHTFQSTEYALCVSLIFFQTRYGREHRWPIWSHRCDSKINWVDDKIVSWR